MGRLHNLRPQLASLAPTIRPPPKQAEGFYQSREWQALVAQRKRDGHWCVICGSTKRLILDHIKERRDGGADLDPANTEWLCSPCHNRKTATMRARRARGQV